MKKISLKKLFNIVFIPSLFVFALLVIVVGSPYLAYMVVKENKYVFSDGSTQYSAMGKGD